jgi:hypothetical protein
LSLLGMVLFGYEVTWRGALVGLVEGGLLGGAFGWLIATAINAQVRSVEQAIRRHFEAETAFDPIDGTEP